MIKIWAGLALALGLGMGAAMAVGTAQAKTAAWTKSVKPFRIASNIYYVGTEGLSAFLVTSSDGAILIDGTLAENAPLVERNIVSLGVPLTSVKWLVSDHAHNDHVGALARIKKDTGAKFAASAGDRVALESGVPRGDMDYDTSGYHFPAIKIDRVMADGDSVTVGDMTVTAHLTPGHTPGCTSWSTTVNDGGRPVRVLFLCSLTVAGNKLVGNRTYPTIVADYEATFAKLSRMQADIVLTSHPERADILGREARVKAGNAGAFIDPAALPAIVNQARQDFEAELAASQGKKSKP